MKLIKARHISTYLRCPKKAEFGWNRETKDPVDIKIIKEVVKRAHNYRTRKEADVPWRYLIKWAEEAMGRDALELTPKGRYEDTKDILVRLRSWYDKYYLGEHGEPGLINLPIYLTLDNHYVYQDSIDIVLMNTDTEGNQCVTLCDFQEVSRLSGQTPTVLYNDLTIHVKSYGFYKASGVIPNRYARIIIGPQSVGCLAVRLSEGSLEKAEAMVKQAFVGIRSKTFYPATSAQCNSCPFKDICSY